MVGVAPDGQSVPTLLEMAKAAGKSVGLVTTTSITHATPACFYAHVPKRGMESEIAAQLVDSGDVDVLLGGGRTFFLPQGVRDPESNEASKRKDDRDLLSEMAGRGYRVVSSSEEFEAAAADSENASGVSKILGLFSPGMMAFEAQRRHDKWGEPSVAEMTELAIKVLSKDPDGYFLMVEGGRIDHACHGDQAYLGITDLIAFDKALKVAKDLTGPDNATLIVVSADHETGGLSINGYPSLSIGGDRLFTEPSSDATPHILTFATGPGADGGDNGDKDRADPTYRQPIPASMWPRGHRAPAPRYSGAPWKTRTWRFTS
jgi:alkaline phosphatase